ncbi:benzoate-CoA ligase family protein [Aromatoleum toluolicum]|uniref:Benzoate-CoA ligase family protein n=1 Tax=Aromatoleum toluolicum TaxID=90060 RepID=A0ABX1NM55_9RHOO|nr:benzoate-CoA ligase family protein [Aromatoleum toluolicum]NMG00312.1 benzoate-CoA ligase family protein [Aromatoleum toluolicum]
MSFDNTARCGAMNAADEIIGRPLALGLAGQPAIVGAGRSVTYGELDALVNRTGNALKAHGVARGERVLFLMDDSPEMVAGYLGTMRIGAVAVALNVRLAPRDVRYVIEDSDCRLLFVDCEFAHLYQEIAAELADPPQLVVRGAAPRTGGVALDEFLAGQPDTLASEPAAPDDIAFWVYSSGTTGRPKAVMHAHACVLIAERMEAEYFGVRPGDRIFATSKMFFGWALGHSLMGGLRCGATVIVAAGWPDPVRMIQVVEEHRPTLFFSTPVMYRNLLREGAGESEAFREVRHFLSAGEKLPETLYQSWLEATGKPLVDGIGASETIFLFLVNDGEVQRPGSCGRPVPWAEVRLVDETGADVVEPGVPGQIAIRMTSQFSGYWKQPEQTKRALRDGWYFPGDMFSFDSDGYWYHNGRADDMLKISGQWVSPSEIEACAMTAPGVAEAVVVGVPQEDGLTRLVLVAVAKEPSASHSRLSTQVQDTLMANLSIYKCPRTVRFVDELPRTATGKIQKFRLRELLQAGRL